MAKKGGWYNESQRHSLAAKGISTGQKQQQRKDRAEWERRKLTEAEKKKGLIFYRKQSQKRRDRDLDLIREQKERAYKDKNTAALDRLNDKENIIIQVNMEKLDEE